MKKIIKKNAARFTSTMSATLALISAGSIAFAQNENDKDSTAGDSLRLEEIIVTATRRATSLATTPQSISAISGDRLNKLGIDDFADLVGSIPGLTLRDQGPGQSRPVIRGIQGSGEGQVGIYYDDTPITAGPGTTNDAGRFAPDIKPIDIERVEVLRGPQGTLYGGGSVGGTLRFISNKPDPTQFEGNVSVEFLSFDDGGTGYQASAVINTPLIEDKLAFRAALYTRDQDGFIDNAALGLEDVNEVNTDGARLALRWNATDKTTITGTYYYQNQEVAASYHINPNLEGFQTSLPGLDPFDDESRIFNLAIEHSMSWADLVYSYSTYERDAIYRYFTPRFSPSGTLLVQPDEAEVDTHELRFTSNSESPLQWTFGAFAQKRDAFVESQVFIVDPNTGMSTGDFFFRRFVDTSLDQKAIFGEASYDFTDKLTFTAGGRWFDIESLNDAGQLVAFGGEVLNPPPPVGRTEAEENSSVFKAHLAYDFSDDLVGYAQWSQGFRAGGANQDVGAQADIPSSYDADTVDNYELGLRGEFLNGAMTLGVAAYFIDWKDIQLTQTDATRLFRFVGNGGAAEVKGIEFELSAKLLEDLTINAGLNLVDAELSSDSPFNDINGLSRTGLSGDPITNVPDTTANISVEYGWRLASGYRAFVLGAYQYTDESFSDFNEFLIDSDTGVESDTLNVEFNRQGDYSIFNLKFGIQADDWRASLFVDNVFNKRAIVQVFEGSFRPDPGFNFVEKPRTIGVSVSKDF